MDDVSRLLMDSVGIDDFVTWTEWSLARVGFRPSNSLALVDVCRDELMSGFDDEVARVWGRPFEIGSLAAMVFVGTTGLQAALSHVPGEDGRHRFVLFCFPHIGIDAGVIGRVQRRGLLRTSTACGALAGFRDQLLAGEAGFGFDTEDVEQSLLRMRLGRLLPAEGVPSLLELTELVRRAAVADARRFVELAEGSEPVDVAVVSGIVVHLPDGEDRAALVEAEVRIDQQVIRLPH